jgi:hypothetical protein
MRPVGTSAEGVIARYRTNGDFVDVFASGGNSNGPRRPIWRDGWLYSPNLNDGVVYRVSASQGGVLQAFARAPRVGTPSLDLVSNGDMVLVNVWQDTIYRVEASTGIVSVFLSIRSPGHMIVF